MKEREPAVVSGLIILLIVLWLKANSVTIIFVLIASAVRTQHKNLRREFRVLGDQRCLRP